MIKKYYLKKKNKEKGNDSKIYAHVSNIIIHKIEP